MADIYRTIKDIFDGIESYAVYTSSGIDQGDLCVWDPDARKAVVMTTTTASGAIFLGVSEESQPLAGLGTATVPLTGDRIRIKGQGIFKFETTASETYNHLDPVFMGANAQRVTLVGSTRMVGRVHLPDGTQVTGATGTSVEVRVFGNLGLGSTLPSSAAAAR